MTNVNDFSRDIGAAAVVIDATLAPSDLAWCARRWSAFDR
jgi:hypothetical protein